MILLLNTSTACCSLSNILGTEKILYFLYIDLVPKLQSFKENLVKYIGRNY